MARGHILLQGCVMADAPIYVQAARHKHSYIFLFDE
jgi:hypothetical protein